VRLRRIKALIILFTASVLLAVAALQGLDLWWRYDRALASAETRADSLSAALLEYLRGAFTLAETSLRQLAIHGRRVGGPSAPANEWIPILQAAQVALPGSGSVSVTDANGIILHSTVPAIIGQSRSDNYIFKHLSANDFDGMVVDNPFRSPVHQNRFLLPVGLRLEDAAGKFEGLAVSVVQPDAFRAFFQSISSSRSRLAAKESSGSFIPMAPFCSVNPPKPTHSGKSPRITR
jgi:hypothetical protein